MLAASLFGKFLPRSSIGCCEISSRVREFHLTVPSNTNLKKFINVKEDALAEKLGLPPAPVHPRRPWIQHYYDRKDQFLHVDPKKRDLFLFLVKEYGSWPKEERKRLSAKYKMDLQNYKHKFEEYKKTLSEVELKLLETALDSLKTQSTKKPPMVKLGHHLTMVKLGHPKRPMSGFLQFVSDRKLSGRKHLKRAGLQWEALRNTEREYYEADYRRRLAEYLKKKEEFNTWYEQDKAEHSDHGDGDKAKIQEWKKLIVKPSSPRKIFQQFLIEEKLTGGREGFKKAAVKWREISSTERARYEADYIKKFEDYKEQKAEFHKKCKQLEKTLTKEDKQLFKKYFGILTREEKEREEEVALVKRPLRSGFYMFIKEHKEQFGGVQSPLKQAGFAWSKLSETEKARYKDIHRTQKEEYKKKKQEFDNK